MCFNEPHDTEPGPTTTPETRDGVGGDEDIREARCRTPMFVVSLSMDGIKCILFGYICSELLDIKQERVIVMVST